VQIMRVSLENKVQLARDRLQRRLICDLLVRSAVAYRAVPNNVRVVDDLPTRFDVWHQIEGKAPWAQFDQRFDFRPSYHESEEPAIRLVPGCLVIDLAPIFQRDTRGFAADEDFLDATAFQAFADLVSEGEIIALDWQHPAYRYSPCSQVASQADPAVPVFPNGDYYAHMTIDLRWGTFGHPWQQTLTVWGEELVTRLGSELLTWLPRHRQTLA
jgi:hypothetical protein